MTQQNRTTPLALGALSVTLLLTAPALAAPGSDPGARTSPAQPVVGAPVSAESAPVTLHLQDTPLRTALQMLFAGSGLQHAVEAAVPNYPITLDIRDIPLTSALRTLLRLAPGVVFRKEGPIYLVGMRPPAVEPTQGYTEPAPPVDVAAGPRGETWEKIPLNYLHPAIAAYVLNGQLVPNELEVQTGAGGLGGYGGGFSGTNGGGFYGGANGYGSGIFGGGSLGYGNLNGYGQAPGSYPGAYPGSINSLGQGNTYGFGTPLVGNGAVVVGPQPRRF